MQKAVSQRELEQLELDMRAMVKEHGYVTVATFDDYLPHVKRVASRIGTPLNSSLQGMAWETVPYNTGNFLIWTCCYRGKGADQDRRVAWTIYFPAGAYEKFRAVKLAQ